MNEMRKLMESIARFDIDGPAYENPGEGEWISYENFEVMRTRILEALEAGIYAIENPDSDQEFALDAMHQAIEILSETKQL